MKKVTTWVLWIAFGITLIAHAIIGVKLLDGNYEFLVEAYIGAVGFGLIFVSSLIRAFGNKCPHCGKVRLDNGEYCSHCGKMIKE
jgi:hypothetical protein